MKKYVFAASCCILTICARGQSVGPGTLNASGGYAALGSNTYEWSIGEMTVVSTDSGPGLVVTHGILQPKETPSSVGKSPSASLALNVYPNPVTEGQLYLQPAFSSGGALSYQLLDVGGKLVLDQDVVLRSGNELQSLNMAGLAAGQYVLSVQWQGGKNPVTANYRIQKTR